MTLKKAIFIIVVILLIDQISKIYIKTHFMLQEEIPVFDWFRIIFIENEGMAWGAKIPGEYGKLALTLFRLAAIVGIGYWLWDSVKKQTSRILTVAIAFIFAGTDCHVCNIKNRVKKCKVLTPPERKPFR